MKLNRKWVLVIALLLSMAVATAGTLAYLTDADKDVNTMTLGKVEIVQNEQERTEDGELDEFTQNKPLYPAVFEGSSIPWAPEDEWIVAGDPAWKVVEDNVNVIDKIVTVTNTGKSDAYVRTILAVEAPEGVLIGYGSEQADIILNVNGNYRYTNNNGVLSNNLLCEIDINGVHYQVYEFCYSEIMKPGE